MADTANISDNPTEDWLEDSMQLARICGRLKLVEEARPGTLPRHVAEVVKAARSAPEVAPLNADLLELFRIGQRLRDLEPHCLLKAPLLSGHLLLILEAFKEAAETGGRLKQWARLDAAYELLLKNSQEEMETKKEETP